MARTLTWAAIAMTLALTACGTSPNAERSTGADRLAGPPADFSLELSIVQGEHAPSRAEIENQPGRYVLLADGSLHYASEKRSVGDGGAIDWLPPLTRILTRTQVAEIWSLATRLGFTDCSAADPAVNIELVPAPADAVTTIVQVSGDEARWSHVRHAVHDEAADPAMSELVRRLAQLAWADETAQSRVDAPVMPKRYDFGPDPYARFRPENRP